MLSDLRVELPPIADAWQEGSVLYRNRLGLQSTWPARKRREESARRALLSVRALVSLEEVYGRGLLELFNSATRREA